MAKRAARLRQMRHAAHVFIVCFGVLARCNNANDRKKERVLATPTDLAGAKKLIETLCGAEAKPLVGRSELDAPVPTKGYSFDCEANKAKRVISAHHRSLLEKGFYLFVHDQGFGIGGRPDKLGLLPTRDPYEVMALVGTNAANYDKGTKDIVAWLRALEAEQPFELTAIGFDFLAGRFSTSIKDPVQLADRNYAFCPDVVDQGVGSVAALAKELRDNGELYFWWD